MMVLMFLCVASNVAFHAGVEDAWSVSTRLSVFCTMRVLVLNTNDVCSAGRADQNESEHEVLCRQSKDKMQFACSFVVAVLFSSRSG